MEDFIAFLLWLALLLFVVYLLGWSMNLWWLLGWF